jgi:hypothetical protein
MFSMTLGTRVKQWVGAVMKGIQGGQPVMRLMCCSGLLMGLEDLKVAEKLNVGGRGRVEEEVVMALAEVMDTYTYPYGHARPSSVVQDWEQEFQPQKEGESEFPALVLRVLGLCAPSCRRYAISGFDRGLTIPPIGIFRET